jgi:membrane dipeptidase
MIAEAPPVSVEDVVDHFDHVARLVGVEHVGIGSDLDIDGLANARRPEVEGQAQGPMTQPNVERYNAYFTEDGHAHIEGLNHSKRVFDLTDAFIRRGYSDDDIRLMLGGNFIRVLTDLWS